MYIAVYISSVILAGFIVGKRIKEKGWLYAGLMGGAWIIFGILISLLLTLLPKELIYGQYYSEEAAKELTNIKMTRLISRLPFDLLDTILPAAIGGFLGEYFAKRVKS